MNGKVQGIIVCGAIAASLAGTLVFLNATGGDKQEDSSAAETSSSVNSEAEAVVLLTKEASEISAVTVTNEAGGFTLDKPSSGKSSWIIEEISTISQNTGLKESIINSCGGMEAAKTAEENAEDLAKYGLEEPKASFEVSYVDGSSKTVLIGDDAPDVKYTYVKLADSDTVYMMRGVKLVNFLCGANDFANLTLIEKPINDDDWPEYGKQTITRSDWDHQVVFENDPHDNDGMLSSQVISEPIFAYLNITGSTTVTHGMWGLTASACVAVSPDEDTLAEYGINEPRCVVNLKGDGYDYTLTVGNEAFDPTVAETDTPVLLGYYCTITGVTGFDAVYIISDMNAPWVNFKIESVISGLMTANYIVDLKEISIDVDGEKTVYEMTTNGNHDDYDEDGKVADVQSVKVNGKDIDVYEYKSMFEFIMACPTSEICFDEPVGEPEVVIRQTLKDGDEDVMELYKDTTRRYIVKLNGKTSFRIQSTWVDSLKTNMEALENGGKINNNY